MVDERVVRDVLAHVVPDAVVTAVEPADWGNTKQTALVTLADGREVVVQSRARDVGGLATEAELTRAVGERTDVPVPAVLGVQQAGEYGAVVTERVPGVDLHEWFESLSPDRRTALARTLGGHLAAVHDAFAFEGYGTVSLRRGSFAVVDAVADWRGWLSDYLARALGRFQGPLADRVEPVREAFAAHRHRLPASPPAHLFPWDFRPGNVIVTGPDATVAAVLDWGEPLAAARGLSFAKAEFLLADWYAEGDTADRLRTAFRDGYRERLPLPPDFTDTRPLYRLVAIAATAVDAAGRVTRPRFPMVDDAAAVAFHRDHLAALLDDLR
jgi:fructosamine-3-kinase